MILKEQEGKGVTIADDNELPQYPTATISKFSSYSGSTAVVVTEQGLHLVDMVQKKERLLIANPGVTAIDFSPKDSYLVTCEKYSQEKPKNLKVWDLATGK